MFACLFLFLLAQSLEIVEREVELVDGEDQEQEGKDDDDAGVAHEIVEPGVEPQAHGASKDGALGGGISDEGEEQRQPNQAKECPLPNTPHLEFGHVGETQADECQ